MKIIYIIVTSLDGRTTQKGKVNEAHHQWRSNEDAQIFTKKRDEASLIIMGATTYKEAKHQMVHKEGKLRVVMTKNPGKYKNQAIPGKLEFTNEPLKELIIRLEKMGHKEALFVGGAHTATEFFKEGLITELWQTLEPKILGNGNGIVGEKIININLKLISVKKLNEKGTLFLKYEVMNS